MKNTMNLLFAFFIFSLLSCTKQTVAPQSSADEIEIEIQKVIKTNNVTRIIVWDDKSGFPSTIPTNLGTSWSFSNGFITICGYGGVPDCYSRNLLYVDSYNIGSVLLNSSTAAPALVIHFKN